MSKVQDLSDWDQLTSLATLGLARGTGASPTLPHASITLPDTAQTATTLLRTAAATFLWKLAGERATAGAMPASEHAVDERQVSASSARRLARMLADEPRELVPEWLEIATCTGAVLPPTWVPAIFDALEPALRQRYSSVFGATLAHLARLDARWKLIDAVREGEEDAIWADGSAAERIAALRVLRGRDTARGRGLVEATWDADPPEFRAQALACMQTGLQLEDESLLERALDDRRKPVRVAAADALGRLRHSAFVQRACARLEPHFVLQPRGTGLLDRFKGRTLEITLPAGLDKAAQRDALETKPPATRKIGERAWWLMQMIAAVPPDVHLTRFGCSPDELLEAARGTDHEGEIVDALMLAATRWHATELIAPIANAARSRASSPDQWQALHRTLVPLLQIPARPERATFLLAQVDTLIALEQWPLAFEVLAQVDADWTPDLTRCALRVLAWQAGNDATRWGAPRNALESWARKADPVAAEPPLAALLQGLSDEAPWRKAVERLHDLILSRIEMRKELSA